MKKAIFVTAVTAVALLAQTPQIVEDKQVHMITRSGAPGPGAGAFTFMSAEASFETSLVKGVPFSGEFVTENAQTLADGNRIKNANTTFYARDGEGRTRREITMNAIGPFPANDVGKHIFIHDPVAKIDYVLDPQEKTARKINIGFGISEDVPAIATKEGRVARFNHRIEGSKDVVIEHGVAGGVVGGVEGGVVGGPMSLPPGIVMHGQAGAVFKQRVFTSDGANGAPTNFKNDSLGKRMIEGVEAEGTRTTLTIPAGQIGNDRALDTVSERWYSNELKTVVLTTRSDPRSGESTYKLTNLRRGEPSRELFEVPSDYKIVTEDNVGSVLRMKIDRMKTEKKQEE